MELTDNERQRPHAFTREDVASARRIGGARDPLLAADVVIDRAINEATVECRFTTSATHN